MFIGFVQFCDDQYYFNRAFSFPGTAGNYAVTDPGAALDITGSFTVECWVKQAVNTGAQIVIQKRLGSTATGYTMYLTSGRVAVKDKFYNTSYRNLDNTVKRMHTLQHHTIPQPMFLLFM